MEIIQLRINLISKIKKIFWTDLNIIGIHKNILEKRIRNISIHI